MTAYPEHLIGLQRQEFVRERIAPAIMDYYYLHLSDLLVALSQHRTDEALRLIDFGAGGSPYRALFAQAAYQTADVEGARSDFWFLGDGQCNAPKDTFDVVLSTQVLEHCMNPNLYLSEAMRVLKPGGKLLLTTHGLFEDHPCPGDFYRWTSDGLRALITSIGFEVDSVNKVTVGPRAAFHLMQSALSLQLLAAKSTTLRLIGRPLLRLLLARRFWNGFLDRAFPEYRVVGSRRLLFDNSYVALLAVARRPSI